MELSDCVARSRTAWRHPDAAASSPNVSGLCRAMCVCDLQRCQHKCQEQDRACEISMHDANSNQSIIKTELTPFSVSAGMEQLIKYFAVKGSISKRLLITRRCMSRGDEPFEGYVLLHGSGNRLAHSMTS